MTDENAFLAAIAASPDDESPRRVFADWLDEHSEPERAACYRGVVKRFGVDFYSPDGALTLEPTEVCEMGAGVGHHTRTHPDGWTISGGLHEDYFVWVNDFQASHPTLGRVEGDFERLVFATSEEAFADFYSKHTPTAWDYMDI